MALPLVCEPGEEGGPVIATLRRKDLQHLTLVIDSAPWMVRFTVDPHKHLIQVPAPLWKASVTLHSPFPDLGCEDRAEPIPPEPHRLMADIDAPLEQRVLDLPQ